MTTLVKFVVKVFVLSALAVIASVLLGVAIVDNLLEIPF